MKRLSISTVFTLLIVTTAARGDGLLFSYEGDVLPGDPGTDWIVGNACEPDCSRRLEGGHFLLEWGVMGDIVNYGHRIALPPTPPPTRSGSSGDFGPTSPSRPRVPVATRGS